MPYTPQTVPDTLWKILPRSATQLERDILKATNTDGLRGMFMLISKAKLEIEPENWLPLLLTEFGFAQIAKEFKGWRALLAVAKDLRGKWGTPYAVEEMARLLRYDNAAIWEEEAPCLHFSEFQLNLGQFELDLTRLTRLRRMVDVIKPVRGRFRRVYHGWDERQHIWDDSFWGTFWDKDSGVDILPIVAAGQYRSGDKFLVSLGLDFYSLTTTPVVMTIASEVLVEGATGGAFDWVTESGETIVDQNGETLLLS